MGLLGVIVTSILNLNNTRHASWGLDPECAPRRVTYFWGKA